MGIRFFLQFFHFKKEKTACYNSCKRCVREKKAVDTKFGVRCFFCAKKGWKNGCYK